MVLHDLRDCKVETCVAYVPRASLGHMQHGLPPAPARPISGSPTASSTRNDHRTCACMVSILTRRPELPRVRVYNLEMVKAPSFVRVM